MPYTTIRDLETAAGGAERLVQIADRDHDGVADAEFIAAAQAKADGIVDSFAGKRYAVPIAQPSAILVQMAADETIYQMLLRGGTGGTEAEREDWEARQEWLKSLSKGLVVPCDPPPREASTARSGYRPSKRAMSRERTKGFW